MQQLLTLFGLSLIAYVVYENHKRRQRAIVRRNLANHALAELNRKEKLQNEFSGLIHHALEIMDTTTELYRDEDEANIELVSCLKALGLPETTYLYTLPNGRTTDAKSGNILIEGKLSPLTSDVDRLIGQLSDYAPYSNNIQVVIYGSLTDQYRDRIQNEIDRRYPHQVFLNYLENPQRQRGGDAKAMNVSGN